MRRYLLRRLGLLPLTLFCIALLNFVIINLAPGEPTTQTALSETGEATRSESASLFQSDDPFLTFREHYGLTLPILCNFWPWLTEENVRKAVADLTHKDDFSAAQWRKLRTLWGDRAHFVLPHLLTVMGDKTLPLEQRTLASALFVRGGTRQAITGPALSASEKAVNRKSAQDNNFLLSNRFKEGDSEATYDEKRAQLHGWLSKQPTSGRSWRTFFFETRFCRYMAKVVTLDFGTLRQDDQKRVIDEVGRRIKYSLTLSLIPLLLTLFVCQVCGMIMALYHKRWPDTSLNLLCLILYAIPIFVVGPFLIEKVAMHHTFPITGTPIPIQGFTSSPHLYQAMTTLQKLRDICAHLALPLLALIYGSIAVHSRLARTAVLEVLRQDYVRTAKAKGLPPLNIIVFHVGRNAAMTVVTTVAGSLGAVLGGSLIVETLFQIDGFGRFFYNAILNHDYNVMMFSALAGSLLTIVGYLIADLSYAALDPRVSLE